MDDAELITNWGLVVEGYVAMERVLHADLEQSDLLPIWFEVAVTVTVRLPPLGAVLRTAPLHYGQIN